MSILSKGHRSIPMAVRLALKASIIYLMHLSICQRIFNPLQNKINLCAELPGFAITRQSCFLIISINNLT